MGAPAAAQHVSPPPPSSASAAALRRAPSDPWTPRPFAPMSGARVTTLRPTLRWRLPTGSPGATAELCRDRTCSQPDRTLDVLATTARPSRDLAPGVWYWRVRTSQKLGPTWSFVVGARNTLVDTSVHTRFDVNGDGYADALGDAYVFFGGPLGLPQRPSALLPGFDEGACILRDNGMIDQCTGTGDQSSAGRFAGDVDGDGFTDVVSESGASGSEDERTPMLYFGGPDGLSPKGVAAPALDIEALGDIDGDGFADVAAQVEDGKTAIFLGGEGGLALEPARTLVALGAKRAGDVDGDGFADFLVRKEDGFELRFGAAAGAAERAPFAIPMSDPEEGASAESIVSGGDINGDGFSDVALIRNLHNPYMKDAFDYRTHLEIYTGQRSGVMIDNPSMSRTWYGRKHAEPRETWLATGDVDGDGFWDIVIGEVGLDGDVLLIEGGPGGPSKGPTSHVQYGEGKLWFGRPEILGDVNGDGTDDTLVWSTDDILGHLHMWLYRGTPHGLGRTPTATWYFFPRY